MVGKLTRSWRMYCSTCGEFCEIRTSSRNVLISRYIVLVVRRSYFSVASDNPALLLCCCSLERKLRHMKCNVV